MSGRTGSPGIEPWYDVEAKVARERMTTLRSKVCGNCGNVFALDAHFCRKCGTPRSVIELQATERAELWKVQAIAKALDDDNSGSLDPEEIKLLLSKLANKPAFAIPMDHPEVTRLSGRTVNELADELWKTSSRETIDAYYDKIFGLQIEDDVSNETKADLDMVTQLVEYLDKDKSGMLSRDEIKHLFHRLSGVPVSDIDDEHPEVVKYSDISTGELIHRLWSDASKEKIAQFHSACGLRMDKPSSLTSILNPRADRRMVTAIVEELDQDGDGTISLEEVAVLFSKLSGRAVADIDTGSAEMKAFGNLTIEELIEKLWRMAPKVTVELYYAALFGNDALAQFGPQSPGSPVGSPESTGRRIQLEASSPVEHKYLMRVERLLHVLDTNADGSMSKDELRTLFSRLHGIPEDMIDDDNEEVARFAGMEISKMIRWLVETVPRKTIDACYHQAFPEEAALDEAVAKAAKRLGAVLQDKIKKVSEFTGK